LLLAESIHFQVRFSNVSKREGNSMRQKKSWFTISAILAALAMTLVLQTGTAAASTYKAPYEFKGSPDGANPSAGLIFDAAGNLYGTISQGGGATKLEILGEV
jgi:hypothetical protein